MQGCKMVIGSVFDYFNKNGLTVVDIPILQPADPFLDMLGEDLRRRIFMTENENGDSLCLRPEFTIPVCLDHIASGRKIPQYYAYGGEVFRQRRGNSGGGFYQAGIEEFGAVDEEAQADARSLWYAIAMLHHISPAKNFKVLLGDHAVFAAVLAALNLPQNWQRKLLRSFGNDRQLRNLFTDLSKPGQTACFPEEIYTLVKHRNEKQLIRFVEQEMLNAGISVSAGRTPQEIATRLIEKQTRSNLYLENDALTTLEDFLAIDVSLDKAEQTLRHFAACHKLDLREIIDRFVIRIQAIHQQGLNLTELRYDATFGRPLDYYTGFVYEIHDTASRPQRLAGGGRYDRLLTMLGAKVPIPAVGFSVWLDQL